MTRSSVAYGLSLYAIRQFLFVANGYRIKSNEIGILGDGFRLSCVITTLYPEKIIRKLANDLKSQKEGRFSAGAEVETAGGSLSAMTVVITIIGILWRGSLFCC